MSESPVESKGPRTPAWGVTIGESADEISITAEASGTAIDYVAPARYALGPLLGSGARGQVYVARDRQLDRDVAVKFLAHEHVRDGHKLASFIREARVTARLEHSSILPVHELEFTARGEPYFTMRVARGLTLGEAIRRAAEGEPPAEIRTVPDRLAVFLRVCDALAYAHDQGVIHRDLKPDNMVIGSFGEVLVLDWGTAASADVQETVDGEHPRGLIGTPAYMAPEQARCEPADQRSDVYALGATLFHLLTLRHPLWLDDPEAFWACKRSGELQPLTASELAALPAGLISIVLRALAADRNVRFESVSAMQLAIRDWQAHAESLQLAAIGRARLISASRNPGYSAFTQALNTLRTALQMWPGNPDAQAGVRETLRAYAQRAMQVGDYGLAKVLAEEAGDLVLVERAAQRRRRMRFLRLTAAVLLVIACALAGRISWEWWQQFATWEVVLQRDLTGPLPAADEAMRGFELTWKDVHQVLAPPPRQSDGIHFPAMHTWWIEPVQVRGDVRIEVDLMWPTRIDGLEVFFNAHREQPPIWSLAPSGYSAMFAGWNGRTTYVSTNEIAQAPVTADAVYVPFAIDHLYHLVVQRLDDRLSMLVDGREVVTRQEILPLVGVGYECIGLRLWADTTIRRVRISRRAIPEKASPLIAGDALVSDGHFASAARIYEEIAQDRPGTLLARRALAKACVTLVRLGEEQSAHRAHLREALAGTPEADLAWQAEALGAWREERWQDALAALDRITDPHTRGPLALLGLEHHPVAPGIGEQLLKRIARIEGITRLDLSHMGLTDLMPLQGMRLQSIDVRDNPLSELGPLHGMLLQDVNISDTDVTDLLPLQSAPINRLIGSDIMVCDLSPLHGMPLTDLDLTGTPISDLRPLSGMPLLHLNLSRTRVKDLSPLHGMPLQTLQVTDAQVEDLRPLQGMPLEILGLSNCRVTSLDGLQRLPLRMVNLFGNPLTDLYPLRGLPVTELNIGLTTVSDLVPLRGMSLIKLSLASTSVSDLSPLTGQAIEELNLIQTPVMHLSSLTPTALRVIKLDGTRVRDLTPLASAPLEHLSAVGAPLENLGALDHQPPATFLIDSPHVATAIDHLLVYFDSNPVHRIQAHYLRVLAAVRDGKHDDALALATSLEGRHYLHVPVLMTFDQARAACKRLGGRLAMPQSLAQQRGMMSLLDSQQPCWIGLIGIGHDDYWLNGKCVLWSQYRHHEVIAEPRPYCINPNYEDGAWGALRFDDLASWIVQWEEP